MARRSRSIVASSTISIALTVLAVSCTAPAGPDRSPGGTTAAHSPDDDTPTAPPATPSEAGENLAEPAIALASPCHAVNMAAVRRVLGGRPHLAYRLAPGDRYPKGSANSGIRTDRYVCEYASAPDDGAAVFISVSEPDADGYADGMGNSDGRCVFATQPWFGEQSHVVSCARGVANPPFVGYVALTPTALFRCFVSNGDKPAVQSRQAARLCTSLAARLTI